MIAVESTERWTILRRIQLRETVLPLRNHPTAFRKRVGDYRIFFDVQRNQRLIWVRDIVGRTSTTYRRRR